MRGCAWPSGGWTLCLDRRCLLIGVSGKEEIEGSGGSTAGDEDHLSIKGGDIFVWVEGDGGSIEHSIQHFGR